MLEQNGEDNIGNAVNVAVKIENMAAGANPNRGFKAMEEGEGNRVAELEVVGDREIWSPLDRDREQFLDANSIFCDEFPPMLDFPCISSSSSTSSSAPFVSKPITASGIVAASSSSSPASLSPSPATSLAVLKSDVEEDTGQRNFNRLGGSEKMKSETAVLSSTASMEINPGFDREGLCIMDCIDVTENFSFMDLMDSNEIWDPSPIFQNENPHECLEDQQTEQTTMEEEKIYPEEQNDGGGLNSLLQGNSELSMIFFEWLKENRDFISAEDVRSIKLKRSTIEGASKLLGTSKEGKKQLLKLILEWVGQFQLQKKRIRESGHHQAAYQPHQEMVQSPNFITVPSPNSNLNCIPAYSDPTATCFPTSSWMPPPPHSTQVTDPVMSPLTLQPPMEGCSAGGYGYPTSMPVTPLSYQVANGIPYPYSSGDFAMMDPSRSWDPPPPPYSMMPPAQYNHFSDNTSLFPNQPAMYGSSYPMFDQNGERLMSLGSSATKEARKKRMARQRKLYSHHNRHNCNSNQNQISDDHHVEGEDCENNCGQDNSPECWMYWPSGDSSTPSSSTAGMNSPVDSSPQHSGDPCSLRAQNYQRQAESSDRHQQGLKTEKNLKLLLQKVLKQSDVGNLGRIVLPKKEAESHLPELESRDGIPIAMEDIGTSRVWNMRYRFWPNNKSRMYLLENTGDFVRVNGLQEGDFIVIYSDTKCGKYMIRGVKVRQPSSKLDGKKPAAKRNDMRNISITNNTSNTPKVR